MHSETVISLANKLEIELPPDILYMISYDYNYDKNSFKDSNLQFPQASVLNKSSKKKEFILMYTNSRSLFYQSKLKITTNWMLNLLQNNLQHMYELSERGWDSSNKLIELQEPTAQYLIIYKWEKNLKEYQPVAYTHYRVDMDYGRKVVYCYEIQLEERVRGRKLGKFLMSVLDLVAYETKWNLIVLTVFKMNLSANKFFEKMGFAKDETNPDETENKSYLILSKEIKI